MSSLRSDALDPLGKSLGCRTEHRTRGKGGQLRAWHWPPGAPDPHPGPSGSVRAWLEGTLRWATLWGQGKDPAAQLPTRSRGVSAAVTALSLEQRHLRSLGRACAGPLTDTHSGSQSRCSGPSGPQGLGSLWWGSGSWGGSWAGSGPTPGCQGVRSLTGAPAEWGRVAQAQAQARP